MWLRGCQGCLSKSLDLYAHTCNIFSLSLKEGKTLLNRLLRKVLKLFWPVGTAYTKAVQTIAVKLEVCGETH